MKVSDTTGIFIFLNLLCKLFALPTSQSKNETIDFFLAKADLPFSTCNEKFYSTVYTAITDSKVSMIYICYLAEHF